MDGEANSRDRAGATPSSPAEVVVSPAPPPGARAGAVVAGERPEASSPGAPQDGALVVSERVFRRRDDMEFAALTLLALAAVGYFLARWVAAADWAQHPLTSAFLTAQIAAYLAVQIGRWTLLPGMRRPAPRAARLGRTVGVATTFVPGAEPIEMMEETVRALVAMDYPHETWVLDEGNDERVKDLCRRLGARHFSRKDRPEYQEEEGPFQAACKHGNYNAWLREVGFARYEIIAAFDPDHIPETGYLSSVLGYFDDPAVGYVQAPQVYDNTGASFIARGAAEEALPFHWCIQPASYAGGYPIIVGGHNTHRVAALEQVGGFAPHHADDILLTLLYRRRGWQGVYVPLALARGLAPVDWGSYLGQQMRWTRAVLDLKLFVYPRLSAGMPLGPRVLGLLHGINYVKGGGMACLFIATVCLGVAVDFQLRGTAWPLVGAGAGLVSVLLLGDAFIQRFAAEGRRGRGGRWRAALLGYAKWPFVLQASLEAISRRRRPYGTTPKVPGRATREIRLWPHAVTILAVLLSWGYRAAHGGVGASAILGVGLVLAALSAGLLATELLAYPAPYPRPGRSVRAAKAWLSWSGGRVWGATRGGG